MEAARVVAGREPLEVSDDEASNSAWCIYCRSQDNDGVYNDDTEDIDFVIKHAETCPWSLLVAAIGPV